MAVLSFQNNAMVTKNVMNILNECARASESYANTGTDEYAERIYKKTCMSRERMTVSSFSPKATGAL